MFGQHGDGIKRIFRLVGDIDADADDDGAASIRQKFGFHQNAAGLPAPDQHVVRPLYL